MLAGVGGLHDARATHGVSVEEALARAGVEDVRVPRIENHRVDRDVDQEIGFRHPAGAAVRALPDASSHAGRPHHIRGRRVDQDCARSGRRYCQGREESRRRARSSKRLHRSLRQPGDRRVERHSGARIAGAPCCMSPCRRPARAQARSWPAKWSLHLLATVWPENPPARPRADRTASYPRPFGGRPASAGFPQLVPSDRRRPARRSRGLHESAQRAATRALALSWGFELMASAATTRITSVALVQSHACLMNDLHAGCRLRTLIAPGGQERNRPGVIEECDAECEGAPIRAPALSASPVQARS